MRVLGVFIEECIAASITVKINCSGDVKDLGFFFISWYLVIYKFLKSGTQPHLPVLASHKAGAQLYF
jgi:hypothetical protein